MLSFSSSIVMADTDMTGYIFFSKLFEKCQWVLEMALREKGKGLKEFFDLGYYFPIVHAEADYKIPMFFGDLITIQGALVSIGESSVTFSYEFFKGKKLAAKAKIVQVLVDNKRGKKTNLECSIKERLQRAFL